MAKETGPATLYPEPIQGEALTGKGTHGYYRRPDNEWIMALPTSLGNDRDWQLKGFQRLIKYGEFPNGTTGEKPNTRDENGNPSPQYYITGHFLRATTGRDRPVPQWVWIYSYIHSILLWPTEGAMVICMLILARPHIIATMTEGSWIRGPTFITVVITLTAVLCSAFTIMFTIQFITELTG